MKTTIEIDDDLLRRAKQVALDRGMTLRQVVEQALVMALGKSLPGQTPLRTLVWPPPESGGQTISSERILREIRTERQRTGAGVDRGHRPARRSAGGVSARGKGR